MGVGVGVEVGVGVGVGVGVAAGAQKPETQFPPAHSSLQSHATPSVQASIESHPAGLLEQVGPPGVGIGVEVGVGTITPIIHDWAV